MVNSLIEGQIESAVRNMVGDKATQIMRGVSKLAAKQGGANSVENYQLLAKRALIVGGVTIVTIQTIATITSLVVSRKREEKRIEQTVRRILEEERQKEAEADQAALSQA